MNTITFFNNKGGVGKTTLIYHVAWMCGELGHRVLAVDLDPQANLTTMFLHDDELERIWTESGDNQSILSCVAPIMEGTGDIADAPLQRISSGIDLLPGDLGLSRFEDNLSESWPKTLGGDPAAFRVMTAFYRIINNSAKAVNADVVLMDVGPNLGSINRACLIASDHVVMPLAPSLFSLQGLRNLGPTLHEWRKEWRKRLEEKPDNLDIPMPSGAMKPAGYVIMQHIERKNRPVKAYQKWVERMPDIYETYVLQNQGQAEIAEADSNRVGFIKNYQSLMPLAEDARKPIFKLTPADGAIGAHAAAVSKCYMDFKQLTEEILRRTQVAVV
jgi:cellulose biosynthesis protein BcsQ